MTQETYKSMPQVANHRRGRSPRVTVPVGIAVDANDTLDVTNSTAPGMESIDPVGANRTGPYQISSPTQNVANKNGWLYVSNFRLRFKSAGDS